MKIKYNKEGRQIIDGKKMLLELFFAASKNEKSFSDEQIIELLKITRNTLDALGQSHTDASNINIFDINDINLKETEGYFYKYVSKETLEKKILKGIFRLGSTTYYKNVDNLKIKDDKEGCVNLIQQYNNKQVFRSVYTGTNYLIYCGTSIGPDDKHAQYMFENFGEKVIRIKNPKSFQNIMERSIGSGRGVLKEVLYKNYNIMREYFNKEYEHNDENISKEEFDFILSKVSLHAIFTKPESYSPEKELRMAFPTKKTYSHHLDIVNKGLIDFIEVM